MSNLTDWIGMEEFEKLTLRGRQNLQTGGGQPTWQLRSKILGVFIILQTGQLAREQATAIIYVYIHWVISSYMDHISMPCYAMSGPPPPCGGAGRHHLLPPPPPRRRGHSSAIVVCGTGARRLVLALQLNWRSTTQQHQQMLRIIGANIIVRW